MCLVIPILPLARLMKKSQGTWLFTGIETVPAILRSFVRLARGRAQDDENGSVLLR